MRSSGQAASMLQELAEGVGRGGKTARHAHAGGGELADHLAEEAFLPPTDSTSVMRRSSNGHVPAAVGSSIRCHERNSSDGKKQALTMTETCRRGAGAWCCCSSFGAAQSDHAADGDANMCTVDCTASHTLKPAMRPRNSGIMTAESPSLPLPNRTVFFVSDGTGITAETFGNSVLAQFDAASRAMCAALHRHDRQGLCRWCGEINESRRARGPAADRVLTLVNDRHPRHRDPGSRKGMVHGPVPHLRRAARARARHQVDPHASAASATPSTSRGVQRPHRGDQLLAGARRRAVAQATWPRPT